MRSPPPEYPAATDPQASTKRSGLPIGRTYLTALSYNQPEAMSINNSRDVRICHAKSNTTPVHPFGDNASCCLATSASAHAARNGGAMTQDRGQGRETADASPRARSRCLRQDHAPLLPMRSRCAKTNGWLTGDRPAARVDTQSGAALSKSSFPGRLPQGGPNLERERGYA